MLYYQHDKEYRFNKVIISLCWLLCLASTSTAASEESLGLPKSVQIHGFLSQGFLHTSDNNLFGHSDDNISVDFRELGINGSWRPLPDLQLALQVVWRNAGQTDQEDLRIDYGVLNYAVLSSESTLLGIKAGRVPTPLGLYNDTRDVASTRPGVLLPQSIYFDRNRNIALSSDGGYLYAEQRTDYGDLMFNIGAFIPRNEDPSFKHSLVGSSPGNFEGDVSWLTRLNYEWQGGMVRLAVTYGEYNADYRPEVTDRQFLPGNFRFNPLIFSAQYNAENWSITGEYALRKTRIHDFGPALPNMDYTGESYYVQGLYNITSRIQGLVRYDQLIWDKNDRDGQKFARTFSVPAYSRFAKDWTFGLRISLMSTLLLSAEYHRINGTGWLSTLENRQTTQHWDLYTLMLSYDF